MNENIITKKEWRFVLLFSIVIMLITILPYLYGYLITPHGKQFTSIHTVNAFDTYWYISLIEQAREGNLLFKYASFPEFQQPTLFHPLFLLIGWSARIFNLANITAYHLFRVILGFIFLWTSYVFISCFIKDAIKRKLAFILLVLGSGFGWIFAATKIADSLTADLWIKEINAFLSIYESPLDMAGITLMLTVFLYFLKLTDRPRAKHAVVCGFATLLLLLIHPYEVFTVFLTLLLYLLYLTANKKIPIKLLRNKFLIIFLLSLPGVFYNYHSITASPALNLWFKSAAVISPSLIYLLSGLGLSVIFSGFAIYKILKQKLNNFYFLLFWAIAAFFLAYQPWLHFQIKFMLGIGVIFAILSAEGIYMLYGYLKKKLPLVTAQALIFWLLILMPISNMVIIAKDIEYYNFKIWPFYLEKDYISAFSWIKNNTSKNDIILSNRDLAYFIPGFTGNTVFWGLLEYYNNPYHNKKRFDVKWFFESNAANEEKIKFLKENKIAYFLYAPDSFKKQDIYDQETNNTYYYDTKNLDPEKIIGLQLIYQNDKTKIYQVE